jgi:hypothetical protein
VVAIIVLNTLLCGVLTWLRQYALPMSGWVFYPLQTLVSSGANLSILYGMGRGVAVTRARRGQQHLELV